MENEPLEPAVLAVELFKEEDRQRRRSSTLAIVGVLCLVIGGGSVFAALRYAPEWFQDSPPIIATGPGDLKPLGPAQQQYVEPTDLPPNPGIEKKPDEAPPAQSEPGSPPPARDPQVPPFDPLAGGMIAGTPVPDGWKPGVDPTTITPEGTAEKAADAHLVTGRVGGGNPEDDANQLAATLRTAGASVRLAPHYSLAGGVIGVQVIATVPAKSVDGLLEKLGGGDKWTGAVDERNNRADGMLASRIRDLSSRKTQLLDKYQEDATEVTVVTEEIEKLNQGLSMVRAAKSPGVAVILIGIGSL